MKVCAIVAMSDDRIIGREGGLPWHLPADLKRFKDLTTGCAVIMGRKTYESLPPKFRPLPGRRNIVITRDPHYSDNHPGVECYKTPEDGIKACRVNNRGFKGPIWIIGGAQIYKATLGLWDEVYLTVVHQRVSGDAALAPFEEGFELVDNVAFEGFSFQHYVRKP